MFNKLFVGFVATMMMGAVASAQVAKAPLETFAKGTAKKTELLEKQGKEVSKKSEEEVAKEMADALLKTNKFAKADLERIKLGKYSEIKPETQDLMLKYLRANKAFNYRVLGKTEGITNSDLARKAGDAMDVLADATKAKAEGRVRSYSDAKVNLSVSDLGKMKSVKDNLSQEAYEKLISSDEFDFPHLLNTGKKLGDRVLKLKKIAEKSGKAEDRAAYEEFKEKASKLVVNGVESFKVKGLEKNGALGEGTAEACANMDKQAVINFADFIEGGVLDGRDVETFIKGMGKRAGAKFDQSPEEGITRVCALAMSDCKMLTEEIKDGCKKIQGRTASAR